MKQVVDNVIGILEGLLEVNKQQKIQLVVAITYLKDRKEELNIGE